MSSALLLDTHIALWLNTADPRLRATTRSLIDQTWKSGGTIFFSAVSAWEIALLADLGRFSLDLPASQWVERFLNRQGISAAALTPRIAAHTYNYIFSHRDPGDRLLIATAIELGCPLVTYDTIIAQFAENGGRQYGFTVAT